MVEACRAEPGSVGLVHALGWYATKHAVGVYSSEPLDDGFTHVDPRTTQAEADALASRDVAGPHDGEATVEATSVVFDRDGRPTRALLALLTADGRRALATSDDIDVALDMTKNAWEGRCVRTSTADGVNTLVT
jgi:acetyl-CoA C-acetyltransferase